MFYYSTSNMQSIGFSMAKKNADVIRMYPSSHALYTQNIHRFSRRYVQYHDAIACLQLVNRTEQNSIEDSYKVVVRFTCRIVLRSDLVQQKWMNYGAEWIQCTFYRLIELPSFAFNCYPQFIMLKRVLKSECDDQGWHSPSFGTGVIVS